MELITNQLLYRLSYTSGLRTEVYFSTKAMAASRETEKISGRGPARPVPAAWGRPPRKFSHLQKIHRQGGKFVI